MGRIVIAAYKPKPAKWGRYADVCDYVPVATAEATPLSSEFTPLPLA